MSAAEADRSKGVNALINQGLAAASRQGLRPVSGDGGRQDVAPAFRPILDAYQQLYGYELPQQPSDDADQAEPTPIPRAEVRAALAELDDAALLSIAAQIIAGWKPLLLKTTANLTDVDLLVEVLRDRAAQFAAAELDEEMPGVPLGDGDLRIVWSVRDAEQAARDAAEHVAIPGEPIDADEPYLPFRRNPDDTCECCWAWPGETCEFDCLSRMGDDQQLQHREDVLDRTLDELGLTQVPVPMSPPRGRHREPEPAGMRPSRARLFGSLIMTAALIIMIVSVGALWLAGGR